jgi:hypothetical protein
MHLGAHKLARPWWKRKPDSLVPEAPDAAAAKKPRRWLSIYNEALWTQVGTIWRG